LHKFYKETQNFNEQVKTKVKLNKITSKRLIFKDNLVDDFAEKEVRFPAVSAVMMSDKISRVHKLDKTSASIKAKFIGPNFSKDQTRFLTLHTESKRIKKYKYSIKDGKLLPLRILPNHL